MECVMCGTEMKDGETTIKRHIQGKDVYFQHIPALVCTNTLCLQEVLLGSTVNLIEDIISKIKEGRIKIDRVLDFHIYKDPGN